MKQELELSHIAISTEDYHEYDPKKLERILTYTNDVSTLILMLPWLGPRLRLVVTAVSAASAAAKKGKEYVDEYKTLQTEASKAKTTTAVVAVHESKTSTTEEKASEKSASTPASD